MAYLVFHQDLLFKQPIDGVFECRLKEGVSLRAGILPLFISRFLLRLLLFQLLS